MRAEIEILTLNSLYSVCSDSFSDTWVWTSVRLRLAVQEAHKLEVGQCPCVPDLVRRGVEACRKYIALQDIDGLPLQKYVSQCSYMRLEGTDLAPIRTNVDLPFSKLEIALSK
jgi:hypothetical protein